ncbi:uncharacterized protein PGTG_17892 [Puccinia graminis f. sp. tritici CRL 75-36-700-3]|uniref:Uncharacterized protein n=1 Tax=Puccinia graminis f. sp. tritici (strain CRL 75-36-700-3 / race SCCL) TaxID=418459 RepID=E3L6I7_PUCGT|nr:uncharacterized protein PGTG_17892 [Puccinia graminis f. sp. tritici CRL 75-36-700-3]EFP92162.2 hypothetical protein PGTG_17892 [Puccinia graminis f. sp. tritici CRL 75-36-700-3]
MANRAGEILQVDPMKLRFFTRHRNYNPEPICRIDTLADMMERPFNDWTSHRIFCSKLPDMPICQVESRRWMNITSPGAHNSDEVRYPIRPTSKTGQNLRNPMSEIKSFHDREPEFRNNSWKF